MKKLDARLGPLDHSLATFACVLAVYSIGMSLGKSKLTTFFVVATILTSLVGWFIGRLLANKRALNYDSYFWAVLGVLATGLVGQLNGFLPEEGFPQELIAAGVLCWLLLVGNLFAWRDQTILFLTLPCIAIFGLVGTFDTFRGATLLFFIFMLTIALLYARVHQRSMIDRARLAGFDEPDLLRRGPWKWMAGPEWALASAFVVVLFSFMGAPVLRGSLQTVAGQVNIIIPQTTRQGNQVNQQESDVRIGVGPVALSENVVMKVRLDMPRYLRLNTYSFYTGGGWSMSQVRIPADSPLQPRTPSQTNPARGEHGGLLVWPGHALPPQEPIVDGKTLLVESKGFQRSYTSIIAPGPVIEVMGHPEEYTFSPQGWVNLQRPPADDAVIQAYVRVPTISPSSKRAVLPEALKPISDAYYNKSNIPARVRDLAYRVSKSETTDYKKVSVMRKAIEDTVLYNTGVSRTPFGKDPVDFFLFESKEGYCDVFASSMALMARSIGLPSRYAIGYIVNDPKADADGFYTVREKDYHAWCEVYFEDIGWVPIDPTAGAASAGGAGVGSSNTNVPWYKTSAFISSVGGVILLAILVPFFVSYREKRRHGPLTREQAVSEVGRLYASFNKTLEKFSGSPKRFSQTTREYVESLRTKLSDSFQTAENVTGHFESAMFSPIVPGRETINQMASDVLKLKSDLSRARKERP